MVKIVKNSKGKYTKAYNPHNRELLGKRRKMSVNKLWRALYELQLLRRI